MKKALFVYNPKAGKAGIIANLSAAIDALIKGGFEVTVHPTQSQGDGENRVREREQIFDRIVCSGGDGTLDEIVTGMLDSGQKVPVGYIPAGSTNDFARSIGIPRNMVQAARVAASDKLFRCDIGKFNNRYFVYVAAFGMFTDVTYETDQNLKNMIGYAAYVAEALKRIQSIKPIPLKISYDDKEISDDFLVGMVSNSNSVGGIMGLPGENVDLADGMFEVLLVRAPDNVIDLNNIIAAVLDQKVKSDHVMRFKCSKILIESDEPIPWTLDGEFGGKVDKADIVNLNKEIDFVVPGQQKGQ